MNKGDSRAYQRGNHLNCTVKVSLNGKIFKDGNVGDISSGGMNLLSQDNYNAGDKLYIHLTIGAMISEFDIFTAGKIVGLKKFPEYTSYRIKFEGMSEDVKIRIDENIIKSSIVESSYNDNY